MPKPRYTTDPANILRSVDIVFQVMAKASYRWQGLFPAVAERHHGNLLMDFPLPPVIPGQRNSDRSPRGCNLAHDVGLLETLSGLDASLNRPAYRQLRENYLHAFATWAAPASPTGLLPWGEHAYWKLTDGSIGNSYLLQYAEQPLDAGIPTHHQICTLSAEIWTTLNQANHSLLPRFVAGLDWHWMDEARTQFNRHAPITQFIRGYQIKRHSLMTGQPLESIKGSDFPGASGVFIHDYAMALAIADNPSGQWLEQLNRFADSWWERRLESGLCPKSGGEKNFQGKGGALDQTTDLTLSLAAAADALEDRFPEAANTLHERARTYTQAVLEIPQPQASQGALINMLDTDGNPTQHTQLWSGNRGNSITARIAVKWLLLGDLCGDSGDNKAVDLILPAAERYLESFIPQEQIVRARDPGNVITFMTEMYLRTQEQRWLDAAMRHATDALERYFDCPLPRAALGRSHYESQQGSSDLVHALARLALAASGKKLSSGLARPLV